MPVPPSLEDARLPDLYDGDVEGRGGNRVLLRRVDCPVIVLAALLLAQPACAAVSDVRGLEALDGDSIEVVLSDGSKDEVRLLSIDAPEKGQPLADEARARLHQAIAGQQLRLITGTRERDRYDRRLAFVETDGVVVNEHLVEEGLAVVYVLPPTTERVDDLLAAQARAHAAKRGLWALEGEVEEPRSYRARNRDSSRQRRILRYENWVLTGNRRSRVAHWPGCRHVDAMNPANRVPFTSVEEATALGYRMETGYE